MDDAFFIILKAFSRAVTSAHATLVVVPFLNAIIDSLRHTCNPLLHKRRGTPQPDPSFLALILALALTRAAASLPQPRRLRLAGAAEPTNPAYLTAANSIRLADEYTCKLREHVSRSFAAAFASLSGMADPALAELEGLASSCREVADGAMRRLAAELLPTAWLQIDFEPLSFELDSEGDETEAHRVFEHGLLRPLLVSLQPLNGSLSASNIEALVHALAGGLAAQLEGSVLHKRFNEAGALVLCEHVRRACDALSDLVSGSVRNEFGRLNAIAFLLNAGSVQEAASLLLSSLGGAADGAGAAGGGVRLSQSEAARVLSLRSDLSLKEELGELFDGLDFDENEETHNGKREAAP